MDRVIGKHNYFGISMVGVGLEISLIKNMKICPKCKSKNILMIEYGYPCPESYDGISEYRCEDCKYRQGRWTGNELKKGEIEPVFGKKR